MDRWSNIHTNTCISLLLHANNHTQNMWNYAYPLLLYSFSCLFQNPFHFTNIQNFMDLLQSLIANLQPIYDLSITKSLQYKETLQNSVSGEKKATLHIWLHTLGEPGRTPLFVGLLSAWGSVDSDLMFFPIWRRAPFWGLWQTYKNEWINRPVALVTKYPCPWGPC